MENKVDEIELEQGLRLGSALQEFWWTRGYLDEGRKYYASLLSRPDAKKPTLARAGALNGAAALAQRQHDYDAARILQQECLSIYETLGDEWRAATAQGNLATIVWDQGKDTDLARSLFDESLRRHRAIENNNAGVASALGNQGIVSYRERDLVSARSLLEQSLAINRTLESQAGVALCVYYLGMVHYYEGEYPPASPLFAEGLRLYYTLKYLGGLIDCLESFAHLACKAGKWERATHLYAAAEQLRNARDYPLLRDIDEQDEYDWGLRDALQNLGQEGYDLAWAEGCGLSQDQAVKYAFNYKQ